MEGIKRVGENVTRRESVIAGALTIGAALVVAAIMLIGRNDVTKAIGLTMSPGVLVVGTLWLYLRERSTLVRYGVLFGVLAGLLLMGLLAGALGGN